MSLAYFTQYRTNVLLFLFSTIVKKAPTPVILTLTLKNGDKYTFEVDNKLFHKLRFNVALILKEMSMLK